MLPIGDNPGPRRRIPYVNYALIAINVVVFILEVVEGPCFQVAYSQIPAALLSGQPAQIQGCPYGQPSPVWVTLFTSMFMHASLLHIGGNMLYLWIFGDNVEDRLGHLGYLIFYLFCGLAADAAQIAIDPSSTVPNLGASGAIAGVLAAYLVFYPGSRVRTLVFLGFFVTMTDLSALIVIGVWFVLQLVSGLGSLGAVQQGGVAYFAHIGGFVAGLVIALLLRRILKSPAYQTTYPAWPAHRDLRGGSPWSRW
ncbi:MAG TPA: rhomboid family intramembrane serine protease [Ktedonobacterales bacterium]|nr:rhomboid family intramembrane serine protease [Ktedonobacterales bacterium]